MGGGGNDEDSKEGGHSIVTICNMSMSTPWCYITALNIFRLKTSLIVILVDGLSESAKFWLFGQK